MKLNEVFKARRSDKRVSLQLVHQETKISIAYLQALESGQWNAFPAEVYLIGFMRKYASYLGLNPDEIVSLYKKEIEIVQEQKIEEKKQTIQLEKENETQNFIRVSVLVFFVAILGGWWLYSITRSGSSEGKKDNLLSLTHKFKHSPFQSSENLSLNVKVISAVWLRVAADDKLLFEGFLSSGTTRVWGAKQTFLVRIGNTKVVQMNLNDHPVDPNKGAVKDVNELLLTPQSILTETDSHSEKRVE